MKHIKRAILNINLIEGRNSKDKGLILTGGKLQLFLQGSYHKLESLAQKCISQLSYPFCRILILPFLGTWAFYNMLRKLFQSSDNSSISYLVATADMELQLAFSIHLLFQLLVSCVLSIYSKYSLLPSFPPSVSVKIMLPSEIVLAKKSQSRFNIRTSCQTMIPQRSSLILNH